MVDGVIRAAAVFQHRKELRDALVQVLFARSGADHLIEFLHQFHIWFFCKCTGHRACQCDQFIRLRIFQCEILFLIKKRAQFPPHIRSRLDHAGKEKTAGNLHGMLHIHIHEQTAVMDLFLSHLHLRRAMKKQEKLDHAVAVRRGFQVIRE